MPINRRFLLQMPVILAGPLSARDGFAAQILPIPSNKKPDLTGYSELMTIYVDTLLPAQGASPAGSALGIPERMLAVAGRQFPYARLMKAGCDWLDSSAPAGTRRRFAALTVEERQAVVTVAESSDRRSLPGQFFYQTHRHAMELFYSHPKAWPALAYSGPPQPVGFLDYAKPPRARSA